MQETIVNARLIMVSMMVALIFLNSVLCIEPVRAAGAPVGTYSAWHRSTAQAKQLVVAVSINLLQIGWLTGAAEGREDADRILLAANSPEADAFVQQIRHLPFVRLPRFSHSMAYYVKQIDAFYGNSARSRSKDVGAVLLCLADAPMPSCR